MTPELTIITAVSARYSGCLAQMLRSARRHGLERVHRFVVYDLGLPAADRRRIAVDFPWCHWRETPALPPHALVARRTYAWKPIVVHAAVREFGGLVLWLDSATLFQGALTEPIAAIRRHGLYTLAGQTMLQHRCDRAVWEEVGAPLEILHLPERPAGVIGVDTTHPVARALVERWHEMALEPRFWRPLGAAHRPEQSLLSFLIYESQLTGRLTLNTGEIDIGSTSPVRWLTTRNKVRPGSPSWADPLVRAYYATYKTVDQALLRWRRYKASRINGWHRRLQEHYRVFVARGSGGAPVELVAPADRYYADPFPCRDGDRHWIFAEEFHYRDNRGRLVAIPVDEKLHASPPRPLNLPGSHLSFPYIFRHEGEWLLLPETSAQRTIDLYSAAQFPDRWQLRRRLFVDVDAADSVLLPHAGRWWLFTSVREPGQSGRALAIFFTDDLCYGRWMPHPVNAERRFQNAPFSYGRCAGPFQQTNAGELLRPIHASRRFYGEAVKLMRIETLSTEAFLESEFQHPDTVPNFVPLHSAHHVALDADLITWDQRDRVGLLRTR